MLKQAHPEWGCQRISDELVRGPALAASPAAVARVLHEAGYQLEERVTRPHPDKVRRFERADRISSGRPTCSRSCSSGRTGGCTWSASWTTTVASSSATACTPVPPAPWCWKCCARRSPPTVRRKRSSPTTDRSTSPGGARASSAANWSSRASARSSRVPSIRRRLGKVERFWGTLWRECLQRAVFLDLEDARRRIGLFIDHYNFQRPHQGLEGATPADRFFQAAPTVLATLKERVAANALELARHGVPRTPFYMTGQVAGQPFSVHAEGERVFLTRAGQPRQEVELVGPSPEAAPESSARAALSARRAGEWRRSGRAATATRRRLAGASTALADAQPIGRAGRLAGGSAVDRRRGR